MRAVVRDLCALCSDVQGGLASIRHPKVELRTGERPLDHPKLVFVIAGRLDLLLPGDMPAAPSLGGLGSLGGERKYERKPLSR